MYALLLQLLYTSNALFLRYNSILTENLCNFVHFRVHTIFKNLSKKKHPLVFRLKKMRFFSKKHEICKVDKICTHKIVIVR